jgi:hypothetical protein
VLARGAEQLGVAVEAQLDPVLDREPGRLAGGLDGVDDLSGVPLADQLLVELELERHGVGALALELVARERLHGQQQVARLQLVLLGLDVETDRHALAQRPADRLGVERGDAAATCGIACRSAGRARGSSA